MYRLKGSFHSARGSGQPFLSVPGAQQCVQMLFSSSSPAGLAGKYHMFVYLDADSCHIHYFPNLTTPPPPDRNEKNAISGGSVKD